MARTQLASVTVTEKYGPTVHHGVGSSTRPALLLALKRRALPSAHHDVEPESQRPAWLRAIHFKPRNHSLARAFIADGIENRIERKQRIAREIHLRNEPRRKRRPVERKMNMRGAPGVRMVLPRIRPGLDGDEAVVALCVR